MTRREMVPQTSTITEKTVQALSYHTCKQGQIPRSRDFTRTALERKPNRMHRFKRSTLTSPTHKPNQTRQSKRSTQTYPRADLINTPSQEINPYLVYAKLKSNNPVLAFYPYFTQTKTMLQTVPQMTLTHLVFLDGGFVPVDLVLLCPVILDGLEVEERVDALRPLLVVR